MKTYTFKLVIKEGSDEFWERLEGITGCDTVLDALKKCLDSQGWLNNGSQLTIQKFEDNGR